MTIYTLGYYSFVINALTKPRRTHAILIQRQCSGMYRAQPQQQSINRKM